MAVILSIVVALICVAVVALLGFLRNRHKYWSSLGVVGPKSHFFFGSVADAYLLKKHQAEIYKDYYDTHRKERFIGAYQVAVPDLILTDLEDIKRVMITDFNNFRDRFEIVIEEREPMMYNVFNASGELWKPMRQIISPAFTTGKLKNMVPLILEVAEEFTEYLDGICSRNDDETEVREVMASFTTDVIGSCGFGIKANTMLDQQAPFKVMGKEIFEMKYSTLAKMLLKMYMPSIYTLLKIKVYGQEVEDFFVNTVCDIIKDRQRTGNKRNDFIDLMMELKNKQELNPAEEVKIKIDENFIVAQAVIFFAAGYETSSTLMSFTLYELALQPEIQDRVYEEIKSVLDRHGGKMSYDIISEMEYLDMVISEAQRKYPALGVLMRMCSHKYAFPESNLTLEPKTLVSVPVLAIHYDPEYYPDPEKFIPERFSSEAKKERHPMTYLPFGEGPRNCVGLRLGKMQSMIGLITVLKDFTVEPCSKTVPKVILDPKVYVTSTKGGLWLKLKRRNKT